MALPRPGRMKATSAPSAAAKVLPPLLLVKALPDRFGERAQNVNKPGSEIGKLETLFVLHIVVYLLSRS
jgi:hypothetical protein